MNTVIFLVVVFLSVFAGVLLTLKQLIPGVAQSRLLRTSEASSTYGGVATQWIRRISEASGPLTKLSLPAEGWENSSVRIRFMNAGLRGQAAPAAYFATKTALTFVLPLLVYAGAWLSGRSIPAQAQLTIVFVAAGVGYFLPNIVLSRLIATRKANIFANFPDALDLITICVEAGLGLDAAIARVGEEIRLKSNALADEFHLMTLTLRAGGSRERALKDLAIRTGVDEIESLSAMLVQAERFGTSIAGSLRVHADSLRTKRRQHAEEQAARVPTKMLFPLIFCVFPSLLVVLLGPAFLSISAVLLPVLAGEK